MRVSTKTLRRWDQRGRFVPTRTAGNQRRYTQEQIDKFKVQSSKLKTVPSMGLGSEAKPLFNQSVPKETKANISLPSILSGFPSGSFLKHHFLLKRKEEVESKEDPEKVFKSSVPYQEKLVGVSKVSLARPVKMGLKFAGFVTLLSLVLSLALTSYLGAAGVNGKNNQILSFLNNLSQFKDKSQSENSKFMAQNYNQAVLAASIGDSKLLLNINVPSIFSEIATFSAGLMTDNQDINAGTGILTASNVLYGLTAGAGISAGAGQTPIITNTGVLSVGGQSGVVALTAGTDISITGVTINDKSTLSSVRGRGGCDGCIVDNDVVNTITISSSGNVSGTAITSGTVGITVGGTGLTSYTTGDILYASGTDTLAKLPIGTSGQALIASSDGVPAWSSGVSALVTLEESNVTVNNAGTLNFLGGDFDLSESPAGQANIQLATTLTTALGVAGNWDVAGILTAGTADAFQVSSAGTITIPVTEDIVFGTVGLNDVGISSVTSGASRVGVYDELANSSGTNLQAVLNDLDAAIGAGSSKWSQSTGFIYLANETDDVVIGGSTVAGANFFFDESASSLYIGTNESANGVLTLYSSGAGITDPALTTDSSGNLLANSANFNVTTTGINSTAIGQTTAAAGSFTTLSATGDVTLNDAGADSILIGAAADTVTVTSNELSLTDNQWSVSVAGAAAFASVNSGSGTIQTTGSVLGNAFDRSTSGALTIGDTNASSVSICNSASCDILTLANNADADTITFGDDLDTFSLSSTGLDVTSAGALSGITTIITSGAINTATITGGTLSGGSVSGGSLSGTTLVGTGSFTVTGGTGASETFSSAATSNQIVLQSTGITGTLSWTPTGSNKAITFPDASGTVAVSASSPIALSAAGAISCTTCLSTVTSFAGDVSGTYDNLQLGTGVATTTEILNDTITATDLNGTLTFADGDYLDLSAILHDDSSPQGLRLPNTGAAPSSPSGGEGYIAYDTITDVIKYYDGSNWIQVSSGTGASKWTDGAGALPTYLTVTSDDLAIGGTDSSSEFYFDIQNGGNFAITSLADTESAISVTANSLTTGKALSVTGTNTATTNTTLQGGLFSFTNAQTTNANTNGITGLGVNFTNNPGIAGNTEYAVRVQNQATTNNTDNAVSALLLLDNADTSDTGSTVITDALRITNSGNISGGVTNAINIDD
ncbi:MAG: Serine-rich adhesin, platelet-type, partial [Candidatus Levybacteria bacterium]|nr:Serine-rich adhesin, platelet-type [Candidatus Levybacteria bacterium]